MKKAFRIAGSALALLLSIYPLFVLLCFCLGYEILLFGAGGQTPVGMIVFAVCGLICVGCCFYLTRRHVKSRALKILLSALLSLIAGAICVLSPFLLFAGSVRRDTAVQAVDSPNGEYRAVMIDSNQGALGGNTFIDVYKNDEPDLPVFKIRKKPLRVYRGRWGEFNEIELRWEDARRLTVYFKNNGRLYEYEIDA